MLLDATSTGTRRVSADSSFAFCRSPQMQEYPVGMNLAHGNTGLFQQCKNGATGCAIGAQRGSISTCVGTTELTSTGMDTLKPTGVPGYCSAND